jgi:hypothetical protein
VDVIAAKAKYALSINGLLPTITDKKRLFFKDAYHPILYLNNKEKKEITYPQTIELHHESRIIVISGPNAGGKTIAVLAGGFNNLYPFENRELFSQITKAGLLISEVMPSIKTMPARFLNRNRLIAALSMATVVVEAEFVSGSIRTARDAAEIFRPVFAIPGQISSKLSDGCHRLIAERIADIATSLDEILEVIKPLQLR